MAADFPFQLYSAGNCPEMKLSSSERIYLLTLAQLLEEQKWVRQCDLAKHLQVSRPSVFRAVSRLEALGLINKEAGLLFLNETGEAAVKQQRETENVLLAGLARLGITGEPARAILKSPDGLYQESLIRALTEYSSISCPGRAESSCT